MWIGVYTVTSGSPVSPLQSKDMHDLDTVTLAILHRTWIDVRNLGVWGMQYPLSHAEEMPVHKQIGHST